MIAKPPESSCAASASLDSIAVTPGQWLRGCDVLLLMLVALLSDATQQGTLLRGARLVALLCANRNPGPYGGSFPRWTW